MMLLVNAIQGRIAQPCPFFLDVLWLSQNVHQVDLFTLHDCIKSKPKKHPILLVLLVEQCTVDFSSCHNAPHPSNTNTNDNNGQQQFCRRKLEAFAFGTTCH